MERLHNMVNGKKVFLTLEEETEKRAQWAAADAEQKAKSEHYITRRKSEYPSIEEQLDMLWHGINNGVTGKDGKFYNVIKSIKDKYRKP